MADLAKDQKVYTWDQFLNLPRDEIPTDFFIINITNENAQENAINLENDFLLDEETNTYTLGIEYNKTNGQFTVRDKTFNQNEEVGIQLFELYNKRQGNPPVPSTEPGNSTSNTESQTHEEEEEEAYTLDEVLHIEREEISVNERGFFIQIPSEDIRLTLDEDNFNFDEESNLFYIRVIYDATNKSFVVLDNDGGIVESVSNELNNLYTEKEKKNPLFFCERKYDFVEFLHTPIENLPENKILCIKDLTQKEFSMIPEDKRKNFIIYKNESYFMCILRKEPKGFKLAVLQTDGSVNVELSTKVSQVYFEFQQLLKLKGKSEILVRKNIKPLQVKKKKKGIFVPVEREYNPSDTPLITELRNSIYNDIDDLQKLQKDILDIDLGLNNKKNYKPIYMLDDDYTLGGLTQRLTVLHIIPFNLMEKMGNYYYVKDEVIEFAKQIFSKKDSIKDYDPTWRVKDDFERQIIMMEIVRRHFFNKQMNELKEEYMKSGINAASVKYLELKEENNRLDDASFLNLIRTKFETTKNPKEKQLFKIMYDNFDGWKNNIDLVRDQASQSSLDEYKIYLVEHDDERLAEEIDMSKPNSAYPRYLGISENNSGLKGKLIRPHYHTIINKEGDKLDSKTSANLSEIFKRYREYEELIKKQKAFLAAQRKVAYWDAPQMKALLAKQERQKKMSEEEIKRLQNMSDEEKEKLSPEERLLSRGELYILSDKKLRITAEDREILKRGNLTEEEEKLLEDPTREIEINLIKKFIQHREFVTPESITSWIDDHILINPSYTNSCLRSEEFDEWYEGGPEQNEDSRKLYQLGCKRPYTIYQIWRILRENTDLLDALKEKFFGDEIVKKSLYPPIYQAFITLLEAKRVSTREDLQRNIVDKQQRLELLIETERQRLLNEREAQVLTAITTELERQQRNYTMYITKRRQFDAILGNEDPATTFKYHIEAHPNSLHIFCPYCAGYLELRVPGSFCRYYYASSYIETHKHQLTPDKKLPVGRHYQNDKRDICSVCNGPTAFHDHTYLIDGTSPNLPYHAELCNGNIDRRENEFMDQQCKRDGGGGVLEAVARNLAFRDHIKAKVQDPDSDPTANFGISFNEMAVLADEYAKIIRSNFPRPPIRLTEQGPGVPMPDPKNVLARAREALRRGQWEEGPDPRSILAIPPVAEPNREEITARIRRQMGAPAPGPGGPRPPPPRQPGPENNIQQRRAALEAEQKNIREQLEAAAQVENADPVQQIAISTLQQRLEDIEVQLKTLEGGSSRKVKLNRRTYKVKKQYRRKTRIIK